MTADASIQPDNRSGLQHALENLLDSCMAKIEEDAPYRTLLFPLLTPEQYLPALAIERGVLDWAEDDAEAAVRDTVANGLVIQSHSCTRQGIVDALAALGINATVTRSGPYEITVKAMLDDAELDESTMLRVFARVNAYKAERDKAALKLARMSNATMYIGTASRTLSVIHIGPAVTHTIDIDTPVYSAMASRIITQIKINSGSENG